MPQTGPLLESLLQAQLQSGPASSRSVRVHMHSTSFIKAKFEKVPLCDDLDDVVLRDGERCYSDCGETAVDRYCQSRVLEPNLSFQKDTGCKSNMECIGREFRHLCVARRSTAQDRSALDEFASRGFQINTASFAVGDSGVFATVASAAFGAIASSLPAVCETREEREREKTAKPADDDDTKQVDSENFL